MSLVIGVLLILGCIVAALLVAVAAGANAYAGWRRDRRNDLLKDPIARHFFSAYRSPFAWHRNASNLKPIDKERVA